MLGSINEEMITEYKLQIAIVSVKMDFGPIEKEARCFSATLRAH